MKKALWKRKRVWLLGLLTLFIAFVLTQRPVQIILQTAPNTPRTLTAEPAITAANLEEWEGQKDQIRDNLETSLYGRFPDHIKLNIIDRKVLPGLYFDKTTRIETIQFGLNNPANDKHREFNFVLVEPAQSKPDTPLILMQNFCPNHDVIPVSGIPVPKNISFSCSGDGVMNDLMHYWFGRYIVSPPIKDIMENGYALGVMFPSEFIPDSPAAGSVELDAFFPDIPEDSRPGALMSWATQSVLLADYFKTNDEFNKIITWGHSRYGKTALLAAAYSDKIDGVISHQSGTVGASLFRDKLGETLSDIINGYPHWLSKSAKAYIEKPETLPHDQHHLLALIAPRPVLLGNARRDVWSDPEGAFRAARDASGVYELYGAPSLMQEKLNEFDPNTNLSFWLRPGTHGIVEEDWPAFLDFLNFHFK